jgi:hemolysin activation/secretion protein
MLPRKLSFLFITLCFLPCFSFSAFAASGLDILDRERDRTPPAPRSTPQIRVGEDRQPSPQDSSIQFNLASLRVSGVTVFTEAELLQPYAGLIGTRVSFETMNSVAAELTKKYRDSGYLLSRAILPAQDVDQNSADIRLSIIEGYISSVEYVGDAQLVERFRSYFSSVESSLLGKKPPQHLQTKEVICIFKPR